MRIGIDLDGVTYDFVSAITKFVCDKFGREFPEPTRWEFYRDWGFTGKEFSALMEEGCGAGVVFHYGKPTIGSVKTIEKLREDNEVIIVTTRGEYAQEATHAWLKKWRIPHDDVILTDKKDLHELDVLLDDHVDNIESVRKAGCRGIVFDRPWNQEVEGERVFTWEEFGELLT